MKAVALLKAGKAEVITVPEPRVQAGELLLKVEFVGMCGTDLNSFRGRNPLVTFPRVIGHEIAATVVTGSDAIPAGSRVTVSPYTSCGQCAACRQDRVNACQFNQTYGVQRDGAMTEYLAVPESKVYASSLPLVELCLVEPLTVGFHAAERARVQPSDTVAVFGCGGVGLGAIAGSAFRGARTVAIDIDKDKLETARLAGATDLVHAKEEDLHSRLEEITGGHGPQVFIEAVGLPDTFRAAVTEVAYTGRVVYIGYAKEPVSYETKMFVQKELDIMGSRNALPGDFHAVMSMLQEGRFPVSRAVTEVVPMDDAPKMLEQWSANPGNYTKIMVGL